MFLRQSKLKVNPKKRTVLKGGDLCSFPLMIAGQPSWGMVLKKIRVSIPVVSSIATPLMSEIRLADIIGATLNASLMQNTYI